MVTGKLPFQGDSPLELAISITSSDVAKPSEVRQGLPAEVDDVIAQCLDKDKDMRYKDISMMRAALESVRRSLE
jgi:serine/threonine-protein kinase